MALIKCKNCGSKISDKALTCPQCGNPVQNELNPKMSSSPNAPQPKKNGNSFLWGIVALLTVFIVVGGYLLYNQNEEIKKAEEVADSIARVDSLKQVALNKAKADSIEAEKQKLEEERKALEEAQKKAEEERKQAEEAKKKAEQETITTTNIEAFICTGNDVLVRKGAGKNFGAVIDFGHPLKIYKGDYVYCLGKKQNGFYLISVPCIGIDHEKTDGWVSEQYLRAVSECPVCNHTEGYWDCDFCDGKGYL